MRYSVKEIINIVVCAVSLLILLVAVPSSFYTVSEQERVVITRFGKPISTRDAGLHFKIPFIDHAHRVSILARRFNLGFQEGPGQQYFMVEAESFMITNDFNFVNVDFVIDYRVSNPEKYLFASSEPEAILRNMIQAEIRTVVSEFNVDEVLTEAKPEIQASIQDRVILDLMNIDIGISLIHISIQDAEPPTAEVITAFKNVENAKQQSETYINQATREYNEAIPAARAEADLIVQEATGYKESRINEAKGQVARFNELFNEYMKNKDITRTRLYLEAMEEILPSVRLIIGAAEDRILPIIDITGDGVQEVWG